MLRRETAFPRCRAVDSRWNKKPVVLGSSVTAVILRPNSCVSSTTRWFHVLAVSIATGTKTWLLASCLYLASLVLVAVSAAASAIVAVSIRDVNRHRYLEEDLSTMSQKRIAILLSISPANICRFKKCFYWHSQP